jgi:O-antigen ligase
MIATPALRRPAAPALTPVRLTGERLAAGAVALALAVIPLQRPAGPGNAAPADIFLALAVLATLLWAGYLPQKIRAPYAASVGILVTAGGIASLAGVDPGGGLLVLVQDLFLLAWTLAVANVAKSAAGLQVIVRVWAWSAIGWAGLMVFAVERGYTGLAGITDQYGGRAALTFTDANMAASYFVVSLMVIWATGYPRSRPLRMAAYALLVAALALTGSNGGIIALTLGVAIATAAAVAKRLGAVAAVASVFLVAMVVVASFSFAPPAQIQQWANDSGQPLLVDSIGRSGASLQERRVLLQEATSLLGDSGLVGSGPRSTKTQLASSQASFVKQAHDDYVATLVERGLLGGVGLLALIASIILRSSTAAFSRLTAEVAAVVPRPHALLGAIGALAVSALFYEVLHFRHFWALLAVIAALHLWGKDEARSAS